MATDGSTETINQSIITEDVVQTVIAELVANAPSTEVKNCLKTYQFGKTVSQLKSAFTLINKSVLVNTLAYLNVTGQNEYVKTTNVDIIVCRIQNLLPDTCGICKDVYCSKNSDSILLSCSYCGQEIHHECLQKLIIPPPLENGGPVAKLEEMSKNEVLAKINPFGIPGMMYTCQACIYSHVPNPEAGLKKKGSNKSRSKSERQILLPASDPPAILNSEGTEENSAEVTTGKDVEDQTIDGNTDCVIDDKKSNDPNKKPNANRKKDERPVCKFFLQKKCKFGRQGDKCKFSHPPLCKKLLKHGHSENGCNQGKHCQEGIHPKMCRHSLKNKECPYENCRFYHVSGTKYAKVRNNDSIDHTVLSEKNGRSHFLEPQPQNLQNFKAEILEAMDTRLALMLSQIQSYQRNIPEHVTSHHSVQDQLQNVGSMMNVPSKECHQTQLNQNYPNQLPQSQEWSRSPLEATKSGPMSFQTPHWPPLGYQQMAPGQMM